MRKLWLGVIGLAAASTANAAVVTYTLSLFDNGTNPTPGVQNFAVYADASQGDNAGIYAYGVDLNGTFGTTFLNRGNGMVVEDTDDTGERATLGFTQGVNTDKPLGKFSGLQDLGIGGVPIPVYGIGQIDDSLPAHVPPQYENTVGTFGAGSAPYKAHFLLARGNWTGSTLPGWDTASVDNTASVYVNNQGIANVKLVPVLKIVGVPGGVDSVNLNGALKGTNQAVGGSIAVTGNNGSYVSEVDQLLDPSVNTGNAPIASIGDEAGSVYVMAKLNGSAADIATLLGNLTNDVDSSDGQFAALHSAYDSQFGAGGFNALFKFPNVAGAKTFNYEFAQTTGVTVDQLAAVPEPTTISLLGLGALGLLARRRRTA